MNMPRRLALWVLLAAAAVTAAAAGIARGQATRPEIDFDAEFRKVQAFSARTMADYERQVAQRQRLEADRQAREAAESERQAAEQRRRDLWIWSVAGVLIVALV